MMKSVNIILTVKKALNKEQSGFIEELGRYGCIQTNKPSSVGIGNKKIHSSKNKKGYGSKLKAIFTQA